jgi:transposase
MAAKCVDRSGSGKNFAALRHTLRDEIFLSGFDRNPFSIDDQRLAALHNKHVLVVIVDLRRRGRGFAAIPERHRASVCAVEDVTLNARGRLAGTRDPVGRIFHECREIHHRKIVERFFPDAEKGRQICRPFLFEAESVRALDGLNVLSLPALGALGHVELDLLAFLQRTETVRLDGGVMNEDVLAVFTAQKSKTLGVIEPLDCACFHGVAP